MWKPFFDPNGEVAASFQIQKEKASSDGEEEFRFQFRDVHGVIPVCATICKNDNGIVDGSSPPVIEVEKNTSSANNPSFVLNAYVSPVVSVAVSPVALVVPVVHSSAYIQSETTKGRKCCSR